MWCSFCGSRTTKRDDPIKFQHLNLTLPIIHNFLKDMPLKSGLPQQLKGVFLHLREVSKEPFQVKIAPPATSPASTLIEVITEIDMSAFDKSQGSYHLNVFCIFLKKLGVPEKLATWWYKISKRTYSKTRDGAISFEKSFQLCSGSAVTIYQNTFIAMLTLMGLLVNCEGIFKSDDSLIFDSRISTEDLERISSVYNMEAKLLKQNELGYYCGGFVYKSNGK